MGDVEIGHAWSLTSTGRGTPYNAKGFPSAWTFYFESSNSTGSVIMQSATSSNGPWIDLGTKELGSDSGAILQWDTPLLWIAPRVTGLDGGGTFKVYASGT